MAQLMIGSQDVRQAAAKTSHSGIFLDLISGFTEPNTMRGVDTIVSALDGRVPRARRPDTRRIVFNGFVTGTSAADWLANTQALMACLDPANLVTLTLADAYYGTTGTWTIDARAVNWSGGPPDYGVGYQSWDIEFESVTPDWATS